MTVVCVCASRGSGTPTREAVSSYQQYAQSLEDLVRRLERRCLRATKRVESLGDLVRRFERRCLHAEAGAVSRGSGAPTRETVSSY